MKLEERVKRYVKNFRSVGALRLTFDVLRCRPRETYKLWLRKIRPIVERLEAQGLVKFNRELEVIDWKGVHDNTRDIP